MNNKGFTLVEVLVAGAIFLTVISAFVFLLKLSANYQVSVQSYSRAAHELRTEMEKVRCAPFDGLPTVVSDKTKVIPVSSDLFFIQTELTWHPKRAPLKLYTLRSRY